MKHYLSMRDVDNYIISAIEDTDTDDRMGKQSAMWAGVYAALDDLRRIEEERRSQEEDEE